MLSSGNDRPFGKQRRQDGASEPAKKNRLEIFGPRPNP